MHIFSTNSHTRHFASLLCLFGRWFDLGDDLLINEVLGLSDNFVHLHLGNVVNTVNVFLVHDVDLWSSERSNHSDEGHGENGEHGANLGQDVEGESSLEGQRRLVTFGNPIEDSNELVRVAFALFGEADESLINGLRLWFWNWELWLSKKLREKKKRRKSQHILRVKLSGVAATTDLDDLLTYLCDDTPNKGSNHANEEEVTHNIQGRVSAAVEEEVCNRRPAENPT